MRRRPQAQAQKIRRGAARRRHLCRDVTRLRRTPMDMPRSETRELRFDQFSVTKHLEHASAQARARNYQDFLIVDVDSHHYENESYKELFQYIESPVIRRAAIESSKRPGRSAFLNSQVGYQD